MKKRIMLIVFSVLIIVALYVLYCFNYIPHKKYTNEDFNIEAYKSNIDKDNDGIDAVDKNIDFRRVKNLKVYFDNNAISLTTDIKEIEEWQGGDIVVFKKHIGIISDKRNRKGICFVIHHANPYQIYYEEDILEHRDDIIGHYRIS